MTDVAGGIFRRERLEILDDGKPLKQLCHVSLLQFFAELRLPRQNDLHEFGVGGFEVGEHADSLKDGVLEILRFVNDEDEAASRKHFLKEDLVELVVHGHEAQAAEFDSELAHEVLKKLTGVALRLKEEDAAGSIAHTLEDLLEKSRLAHAGFGDEGHEAAIGENGVGQRVERGTVRLAGIEIRRIRRDAEGLLAQAVKVENHSLPPGWTLEVYAEKVGKEKFKGSDLQPSRNSL